MCFVIHSENPYELLLIYDILKGMGLTYDAKWNDSLNPIKPGNTFIRYLLVHIAYKADQLKFHSHDCQSPVYNHHLSLIKNKLTQMFKKTKSQILKASSDAVSLFDKAINALKNANEGAGKMISENEVIINDLQVDNKELQSSIDRNNKIVKNIEAILEA